ncbi:MAG TPA: hypothetical protein VM261_30585, partial [Kofleriaceae bacterium]|nr:hypothetical protein [Kofleriaceae bacterium]
MPRPLAIALTFLATLVPGGCARPDPHSSPEAAARAFITAANGGDIAGMRAAAVAPERLARAIACPPDDTKVDVVEAVASARETMNERAGMNVHLRAITETSRRAVAVGDDYRGCRVTEAFELRRLRMNVAAGDGNGGNG